MACCMSAASTRITIAGASAAMPAGVMRMCCLISRRPRTRPAAPMNITAAAGREILVSSGAYNSPQLLQLSGVGPADLLKGHGIEVVLDAPGVGNDLQDHMQVRIVMRSTQAVTLNDVVNHPVRKVMAGLQWA